MESSVLQHHLFLGLSVIGLLAGMFFAGRRRRYVLLGFSALLAVTALNTIFVSESRMSIRMTPLLFAVGIGGLGAAVRARRGADEPILLKSSTGSSDDTVDDDADAERETPADADETAVAAPAASHETPATIATPKPSTST